MSDDLREQIRAELTGGGATGDRVINDHNRDEVIEAIIAMLPSYVTGRCDSIDGVLRCQGELGHAGAHWADVGRSPAVMRWGMRGMGCFDPECNRKPGHDLPHRNGRGHSWWPLDADDEDEA